MQKFFIPLKVNFVVWAEKIEVDEKQRPKFILSSPSGCYETKLSLSGKHNVINAVAAANGRSGIRYRRYCFTIT